MDPISLSASIAGLCSLSIEVIKLLHGYITGVKSAPDEAQKLHMELSLLTSVLDKLVLFLRSEDMKGNNFEQTSTLTMVYRICRERMSDLYRKMEHFDKSKKVGLKERVIGIVKWPFIEGECIRSMEMISRCTQCFQFSLSVENW